MSFLDECTCNNPPIYGEGICGYCFEIEIEGMKSLIDAGYQEILFFTKDNFHEKEAVCSILEKDVLGFFEADPDELYKEDSLIIKYREDYERILRNLKTLWKNIKAHRESLYKGLSKDLEQRKGE